MKINIKKTITIFALFISIITFSQVPQGISYQAIALNGSGNPVVSSNVGLRISVLDNSISGTNLYTETYTKTTNPQGLFNLIIGQGTSISGTFATINWGTNSKFLKVELDAAGGTNYTLVGTTQLLSVPYALAAGSLSGGIDANNSIENNKTANFCFASNNGNVYAFNSLTNSWVAQSGSVNSSGGLISSNMNFCFASNSGNVYAFNASLNSWVAQSGYVNTSGGLISSNGNFCFASNSGNVYAFNKKTNVWTVQSGSVNSSGGLISSPSN